MKKWYLELLSLICASVMFNVFFDRQANINVQEQVYAATTTKSDQRKKNNQSQKEKSQIKQSAQSKSFNSKQIKHDVEDSIGSVKGTNSVFISPVNLNRAVELHIKPQRSASSIKIFILATAFLRQHQGKLNLSQKHVLTDEEKVTGTGVIQNMEPGTVLTYRELLNHMIEESDNTATNIIIDAVGGMDVVNETAKKYGATQTKLQRKMMDTDALNAGRDNETTAKDLGVMIKKIYNRQVVSKKASKQMLTLLKANKTQDKLNHDLPKSAVSYHKDGEFTEYGVQNDTAIIQNKKGAFVVSVMSENGEEDPQKTAMSNLGKKLYQDIL